MKGEYVMRDNKWLYLSRGKEKDSKDWVYGSLVMPSDESFAYICESNGSAICPVEVAPETVGRYTGMTDDNDTYIFTGDIVHLYGDDNNPDTMGIDYIALVTFNDGSFCAIDGTPDNYGCRRYFFANCDLNCEVIGNIYDNEDLRRDLEGEV